MGGLSPSAFEPRSIGRSTALSLFVLSEETSRPTDAPRGFRDVILGVARGGEAEAVKFLTKPGVPGSDAAAAGMLPVGLAALLEQESRVGTAEDRAVFSRLAEAIRAAPVPVDDADARMRKPTPIGDLLLSARVALTEASNDSQTRIDAALERFQSEAEKGIHATVTAESFAALSKALGDVDPKFRDEWHRAVLRDMPWLDRLLAKPRL